MVGKDYENYRLAIKNTLLENRQWQSGKQNDDSKITAEVPIEMVEFGVLGP